MSELTEQSYNYFISYWYKVGNNTGFDNCKAKDCKQINNVSEDILELEQKICRHNNFDKVSIINYKIISTNIKSINEKSFGEY